jgi:hypothetical protein
VLARHHELSFEDLGEGALAELLLLVISVKSCDRFSACVSTERFLGVLLAKQEPAVGAAVSSSKQTS